VAADRPWDEGTVDVGGRPVGFRWFGARRTDDTRVVLSCHGGLSCGADAALGHGAAQDRDVSLLAIDRPGVAASGPLPGRCTADFTADVVAVLDGLDVARAAGVVGWSLGGQYALAAARAADRVPACALVGGVPPLSWPGVQAALSTTDRALLWAVGGRAPRFVTTTAFRAVHRQAVRTARKRSRSGDGAAPGRMELRTWGPVDAAVLAGPAGPVVDEAVVEATMSVDGMVEEYRAWARDWGFAPAEVTAPVVLWQGDQDHWVPAHLARRLADALPRARVEMCAGIGHLLLADRWGDVLDGLVA
jgi:pimeloyl-ACP methyl ester carboxylesterase